MTRKYVRKTAPLDGERKKSAVVEFFRLKAAKLPAPLKNAAFGRVKEPTLCGWVKGHATAEAALAALAQRPQRGGQTVLPERTEKALAALILTMWQSGMTLTTEQVLAMATIQARAAGTPFKVRFRLRLVSWGFRLSPPRRMPPGWRRATGTTASAPRTGCPGTAPSAAARNSALRRSVRAM
jgi:hypothetical protein